MFKIDFYTKPHGASQVREFINDLRNRSSIDHDAQIQLQQMNRYIQLLSLYGARIGLPVTRHLEDDIRELRPGCNRILFFFFRNDAFVLLHIFRKKGQKTPRKEIERAKSERDDWLRRMS